MIVSGSFLPSTTYQFRVRATGYTGWPLYQSLASDDVLVSVTTAAFPSAPGQVTAIALGSDGVRLSWELRPDVTVVVERMSGGVWASVAEITSAVSSYEDYGLEPSTAYLYRIAFLSFGAPKPASAEPVAGSKPATAS